MHHVRFRVVLIWWAIAGVLAPAWAGGMPRIARDTPYSEARKTLSDLGYTPIIQPDADKCDTQGNKTCFPERVACAGSGLGQCIFAWRKGASRIEIVTIGEMPIVHIVR